MRMPMRILVTVSPLMYRESIALYLHQHSPGSKVMLAPPGPPDGLAGGFDPHLIVRDEDDVLGADAGLRAGALCRVGLFYDGEGMHARIGLDGASREVGNVGMGDLMEVLDQTERLIPQETADRP